MFNCNFGINLFARRVNNSAVQSSNRGNDNVFKGATLDIAHIKLIPMMNPDRPYIIHKYKQHLYAKVRASESPSITYVFKLFVILCDIDNFLNADNFVRYSNHCSRMFTGTESLQSIFSHY